MCCFGIKILRSGTVLFLGGLSRLRMHGVSKIFPAEASSTSNEFSRTQQHIHMDLGGIYCSEAVCSDCDETVCGNCNGGLVSLRERNRLEVYLQNYRVNINVRQVFPTVS